MFFRNAFFKEQLSVVASVRRENILALTIRIGMCVFLCSNKMKYHLLSLKRPCYTSNNKIYDNNPNILIELVYVFNRLSGLPIIGFIIWQDNRDSYYSIAGIKTRWLERAIEKGIFYPNSKQRASTPYPTPRLQQPWFSARQSPTV